AAAPVAGHRARAGSCGRCSRSCAPLVGRGSAGPGGGARPRNPSTIPGGAGAPNPFTYDGVRLNPVKITASEVQDYYEGFSNDTLWPLYHDALRDSTYNPQHCAAYSAVNERFAEILADVAPPNAIVWIHDYHLQLVPQLLRDRRNDLIIGFFFPIPFP